MAMDATMQVRMDSQLKEKVEKLYKDMGTTFSEAVRMFAQQSVAEGRMPFRPRVKTSDDYTADDIDDILRQSADDIKNGEVYTLQEFAAMMGDKYAVKKAI